MKNVEILNLTKQEIKYTIKLKRNKDKAFKVFVMSISCIFVLTFVSINVYNLIGAINPVNSLYRDNSGVVFTDADVLSSPTFFIPIKGDFELLKDGTINFIVGNSIMVKAIENGVIEDVTSSNDGIKYIKINHGKGWSSVICNVDIVGVKGGDIVTRGKDIATAKLGQTISLRIYLDGVQVSNLSIAGSKILCLD
ncbi:MAG: hypothetical protein E7345_01225 [Clostridiales bacterium]|nr:hypothetical protein [Clostridiales bacterium]